MTLQIHDELLFEVPEAEVDATRDLVREAMATVWTLTVPLVVEVGVGRSWAAAKEASG
jgi:DNA polymerase-1